MRTFCESESGGGKSAKRDLGVAVVLPRVFYPLGFITLGFTSLVSTPSAFINKTGTVLFPLAIN